MAEWKKTGCVLCAQNCGLEVQVENNRIVKVKGDKNNPRSQGYVCRKGMNVGRHQHHAQRLSKPLKKNGDRFDEISWDQAVEEIAEKLKGIVDEHGPRSFAYMGGGGQGCHFEAAFGLRLLRGMGSRYHYSALAQELTGQFWGWGRAVGKQYLFAIPDDHNTDMLMAVGWNGMKSHQMPRAPIVLRELSRNPDKLLVVVDPRKSETAQIADIHLPIRPGTDALLFRAMIALILEEGWEDTDYIRDHVTGFSDIKPWFENFDVRGAVEMCGLDFEEVRTVAREFASRTSSLHPDLGVLMNRHSTATTYLLIILLAVCGRICVPGGNVIPGHLMPIGSHTDERSDRTWRTMTTDFPALMGTFPPNVMPEEILSDHPQRLRVVFCAQSNPLRSYADTPAYEQAFNRLDLLVTAELAMTETAALSHYVLPSRSGYESWDSTFFAWTYPEIYFQMRRPVVEPEGERLEVSQMMVRLADRLGLLPDIPEAMYDAAASGDRLAFGAELMAFVSADPTVMGSMPFILAKTLGETLGSANLAALWGMLQVMPPGFIENAARVGFEPGPDFGERLFQAILDNPQGLWIGRVDPEDNFASVRTEDGRINVYAPEMDGWIRGITPEGERETLELNTEYPFVLNAGRHMEMNANTLMRDPSWNEGMRACTLAMNPEDAARMALEDGQEVRVTTEAGSVTLELEVTDEARVGSVIIPHGFGLVYEGKVYGVNVNMLTKNTHRDRFAATPLHRFVPCRVEAV